MKSLLPAVQALFEILHRPMSFTLNNEPLSPNAELAPADYYNKDKERTRENAARIHKHLRTSALHHNRLAIQSPWVLMTPPMLQKAIPRPVKIKAVHLIPSCVLKLAFKFLSFMIQLFLSWGCFNKGDNSFAFDTQRAYGIFPLYFS